MWDSESERRRRDGTCVSCGYLNPPGSSWCHRCGAGWLDRTEEQPVVRAPDSAEPLSGPLRCRHVDPSEGWRRKRPASVAARALTGAAIVAWIFAVGAVVVLNSGGSAGRATRDSRTPAQKLSRGRSAAVSALAERQTVTTRSPVAPASTATVSGHTERRSTTTRSPVAPASTATVSGLTERRSTTTRSLVAPTPTAPVSALAENQTATARPPTASAPTAALDAYWQNVKRHAFADAYAQLQPGTLNITEAQFVASEKQIKIQNASFRASVTAQTSSRATVAVGSLITHDQRYGCQTWSGSYELIETAGRWRTVRAPIPPRPCVN